MAEGPVLIKKYGDGVDDDQSTIGCLIQKDKVRIHDWGQINPEVKVTQSSVECDFSMDLAE